MNVKYEKPKVEQVGSVHCDQIETHPSYGMISASRVSGNAYLYGSDFSHQHYITISIHRSELKRNLSNDWPSHNEELIEVAVSEAQWASFISSLNQGAGTQCTIQDFDRKHVARISEPTNRKQQFTNELEERFKMVTESLNKLITEIEATSLSGKAKTHLTGFLNVAIRNLEPNMTYVAEQFAEHIEVTTQKARAEVSAYLQSAIQRAGIESINHSGPVAEVLITAPTKEKS